MATVSTHVLNSVDGTHAGGVKIDFFRLDPSGQRSLLVSAATDSGGRLVQAIEVPADGGEAQFEIVLHSGAYFANRLPPQMGLRIVREIVIRFAMPDPAGRYHIPMMLAPNSHSVWWSS